MLAVLVFSCVTKLEDWRVESTSGILISVYTLLMRQVEQDGRTDANIAKMKGFFVQ